MKVLGAKVRDDIYDEFEKLCEEQGLVKNRVLYLLVLEYLGKDSELKRELFNIKESCLKRNEYCRKVYGELGKIGSNVNQIARALNRKRLPAKEKKVLLNLVVETMELIQELKMRLLENGDIKES